MYVWNRVKYIQESEIEILWTASETNVADLVTKEVKLAVYINFSYWAEGQTYLKNPDCEWKEERKIGVHKAPTNSKDISQDPAVKKGIKVKKTRIQMNLLKILRTQAKSNLFARCKGRSNDLIKF